MRPGLLPLLIVGPLGLILLILTFFSKDAGEWAIALGTISTLVGGAFILRIFHKKGIKNTDEGVPWYLRGGVSMVLAQIYYAKQYPRALSCWVAVELFGFFLMLTAAVILGLVKPPSTPLWKSRTQPSIPELMDNSIPVGPVAKVTGVAEIDDALACLASPKAMNRGLEKLVRLTPDDYSDEQGAQVARRLARLVKPDDPFGNALLIKALGLWATFDELPVLIQVLDGTNHGMRAEALRHIAKFKDETALPAVARCLENGLLRDQAGEVLLQLGRTMPWRVEKVVLPILTNSDNFVRKDAIDLLKEIGTERCIPALQALVDNKNPFIQHNAKEALAAVQARVRK